MTRVVDVDKTRSEARFWAKVEKHGPNECWLWQAALSWGYGMFRVGSRIDGSCRTVLAHRFAYESLVGPIPEGMEIDHLCRNPACVNPAHMEAVSHQTNILRGNGLQAKNATLQYCPRGHPYDLLNTYFYKGRRNSGRYCRICNNESHQRRAALKREVS